MFSALKNCAALLFLFSFLSGSTDKEMQNTASHAFIDPNKLTNHTFVPVNNEFFNDHYDEKIHNILPNLTIRLIFPKWFFGERHAAVYYQEGFNKYGINALIAHNFSARKSKNEIDLVIAYPDKNPHKPSKYTYIFLQTAANINNKHLITRWQNEKNFKQVLQIGKNCCFPDISAYGVQKNIFFTVPGTPHTDTSFNDATLFFCGGTWDERYTKCLSILDAQDFFNWYGPSSLSSKKSYKGFSNNIIESIKKHKIALILHSHYHKENEEPTMRIFEAAASGAVIISDSHPFIIDNFGDSVLYVNHNNSEEEIARDIIKHYEWIKRNPLKARELAQRAHSIFIEKFTLEDQLLKFIQIHQETLVLDGLKPLPPRSSFSHRYYKTDLKLLNKLLKILMPQKFSIKNFTNNTIDKILSFSFITKNFCSERKPADIYYQKFELEEDARLKPYQSNQYSLENGVYLTTLKESAYVSEYFLEWNEKEGFTIGLMK